MVRSAGRADPMPNSTVMPNFANNLHSFRVKDYVSSFNFFNDVGTHYISSYLTGNSIYQVRLHHYLHILIPLGLNLLESTFEFFPSFIELLILKETSSSLD